MRDYWFERSQFISALGAEAVRLATPPAAALPAAATKPAPRAALGAAGGGEGAALRSSRDGGASERLRDPAASPVAVSATAARVPTGNGKETMAD